MTFYMLQFAVLQLRENRTICLVLRMFTRGPQDRGSIPSQVLPKIQKIVLDSAFLNTQHYKVWVNGKIEQSRERSSALHYTIVLKREPSGHSRLWSSRSNHHHHQVVTLLILSLSLSFSIHPYCSSHLESHLFCIRCPLKPDACKYLLMVSTGVSTCRSP